MKFHKKIYFDYATFLNVLIKLVSKIEHNKRLQP